MRASTKRPVWVCVEDCDQPLPLHPPESLLAVDELPTPVAVPLAHFLNETHSVLWLHRLCDSLEVLTRFLAVIRWMDLRAHAPALLAEKLPWIGAEFERPTFGQWAGILRSLSSQQPANVLVPEIAAFSVDRLLPLLGNNQSNEATHVIALRNQLSHIGVPAIGHVGELITSHNRPEVRAVWTEAATFLQATTVSVGDVLLRGRSASPAGDRATPKGARLWRDGRSITLFPLVDYDRPTVARVAAARRSDESSALLYLRCSRGYVRFSATGGLPFSDRPDLVGSFVSMFAPEMPGADETQTAADGVEQDLREDASLMVGRSDQVLAVKTAVKDPRSSLLWLSGAPGSGKSTIAARVALDLKGKPRNEQLVVWHRFRAGDSRCTRGAFLATVCQELGAWLFERGLDPGRGPPSDSQLGKCLEQVARLTTERVVIVVDGIDEVARGDLRFPEWLTSKQAKGLVWLVSGRPELTDGFSSVATAVFPGGLPPMEPDDVRAMFLTTSGDFKYDLLLREGPTGNPFVSAVISRAGGLPLYVRFVIDDIRCGELKFSDEDRLPRGLTGYYDELTARMAMTDLHGVLVPLMAGLAWAEEPLSLEAFTQLIGHTTVVKGSDAGDLVRRALEYLRGLLREAPTPDGQTGYLTYHDSLRTYLRSAGDLTRFTTGMRDRLAELALLDIGGPLGAYFDRYGPVHLLNCGRYADAVSRLDVLVGQGSPLAMEALRHCARRITASLVDANPSERALVPVDALVRMVLWLNETQLEVLAGAAGVIVERKAADREHGRAALLKTDRWEAMHALAQAHAELALETRDPARLDELLDYASRDGVWQVQFGLYGLSRFALREPFPATALLTPFLLDATFARQAVLGELLLSCAMRGDRVSEWMSANRRWESSGWGYHTALYDEAAAFEVVHHGNAPGAPDRPEIARLADGFRTWRERIAALVAGQVDPAVRSIFACEDVAELPKLIQAARLALMRAPLETAELLLGHPAWDVRTTAATVIAGAWPARPELAEATHRWLNSADWHTRYGAMKLAQAVRVPSAARLVEEALRERCTDSHPWIRGICADFLLESETARDARRLAESFEREITLLAADTDVWAAASTQMLLRRLRKRGVVLASADAAAEGALLGRIPEWRSVQFDALYAGLDQTKGIRKGVRSK